MFSAPWRTKNTGIRWKRKRMIKDGCWCFFFFFSNVDLQKNIGFRRFWRFYSPGPPQNLDIENVEHSFKLDFLAFIGINLQGTDHISHPALLSLWFSFSRLFGGDMLVSRRGTLRWPPLKYAVCPYGILVSAIWAFRWCKRFRILRWHFPIVRRMPSYRYAVMQEEQRSTQWLFLVPLKGGR